MPVVGNLDPSNPRVSSSPAPRFLKSWTIKRAFMATSGLFVVRLRSTNCIEIQPASSSHELLLFQAARLSVKLKNNITLSDTSHNQKKIAWTSTYILLWSSLSKYDDELIILDIRPEYLFLKCFVRRDLFLKYLIRQGGHIYHNFLIYQYMTS